jgi:gamma-carbonic anhydrase
VEKSQGIHGKIVGVLVEHRGRRPQVHESAYVAPTAVLCGDVRVGAGARILFGAVVSGEDGFASVGERCVVMENALLRGRADHPLVVGDDVLVGPHAHLNGAQIGNGCFLATGAGVFPGAVLGPGCEVRINGVVHVNTVVPDGVHVPIGWIAAGDPAELFSPDRHDELWAVQKELDFPGTVYGVERGTDATTLMRRQSEWFGAHRDDRIL